MLNLPLALRLEKNKIASTLPWLVLLDVTLPDTSHIRLVRNTDNITYNGYEYTAFEFNLGDTRSGGDARIQGVTVKIANPERALQPVMETYDGLIGCDLSVVVVHAGNLATDHSELTLNYEILTSHSEGDWIAFIVGAENPIRRRFPLLAANPRSCNWIFKGAECAYSGSAATCERTLNFCRSLSNSARFGGRPGISGAPRFIQ